MVCYSTIVWVADTMIEIYLPLASYILLHTTDCQLARSTDEMHSSCVWELYLLYSVHITFAKFMSYVYGPFPPIMVATVTRASAILVGNEYNVSKAEVSTTFEGLVAASKGVT